MIDAADFAGLAIGGVMIFTALAFLMMSAWSSWNEPEQPRTLNESLRRAMEALLILMAGGVVINWLDAGFELDRWKWNLIALGPVVALLTLGGDALHRRYRKSRPGL